EISYRISWNTGSGGPVDEHKGRYMSAAFGKEETKKADLEAGGLKKTGCIPFKYAKGLDIDLYGSYRLINIHGAGSFLLVPEGMEAPAGFPEDITILSQPFDNTYLVSTSAMDLVRGCGSLDRIRFSPLEEDDWYLKEAADRMKAGDMVYAGKYRTPDYELLVGGGCDLAVENTMIYHDPEVIDKLSELGIPVIVETSSYESDPLGRLEWIKLYGILFDAYDKAEAFFDEEEARIKSLGRMDQKGPKVAFFSLSSSGLISVRKRGDYMVSLIELAGGSYVPADLEDGDGGTSSMNMQMEDFYAACSDADVIIYNSTIGDEPDGIGYLTDWSPLFKDFKAVKEGKVYVMTGGFFQMPTKMADLVGDIGKALSGSEEQMEFLYPLK
nr:ABC transporter substrate-binding protein [Lachnospiraceae bacterium]